MIKIGLLFLIGLFFTSCMSKKEEQLMNRYVDFANYHKYLQKTEKIQLYENGLTKLMITATYISVDMLDIKNKEQFILGVHNEDDYTYAPDKNNILLNGKKIESISVLSLDDKLLKDVSFTTKWSKYYLVVFPSTTSKKLMLSIKDDSKTVSKLYFAKVAKYSFTKKGF